MPKIINVSNDFSRYPAGRYTDDGPHSGQRFRDDFLKPILINKGKAVINLDGVRGYGSSFLEEAFGGLVRDEFDAQLIFDTFTFQSADSSLIAEIREYVLHGADSNM